jgi:ABC-type transport system involved in multi-copper enzyme maturation permease subunit
MIPALVLLIAKIIQIAQPGSGISESDIFSRILLIIYIQLLLPIMALFFGTSVVHEEIDNRTLVYLTTSPISKKSILIGKYLAQVLISATIISIGFVLSFLIININQLGEMKQVEEFLNFLGVGFLAICSYTAFFTLLGSVFRKSILLGLFFVFGWESMVQYFPGTTQKFTIIHYVKSLLPESSENIKFLVFRLEPSPVVESIVVLSILTGLSLLGAAVIFNRREYVLGENSL